MIPHWMFVTAAWGVVGAGMGALILGATVRHRTASRRLRELDRVR